MYLLFRKPATRFTGQESFGELPYLRRSFLDQIDEIKTHYNRFPKRVDSDNVLGNILLHIAKREDLDDQRYLRFVEDTAEGVSRAFGLTSSIYRGRVHEGGLTLGPKVNEVMISVSDSVDLTGFGTNWNRRAALQYLYHTRTDLAMPIPNNTTPGKGLGVSTINIPLMALQYRYWLRYQKDRYEQKESVYRFIGGFVLPNAITSYLDVAFFNRLARLAGGINMPKHPLPHPFYLTDFSAKVDKLCERILAGQERRSGDLEQVVNTTPVLVSTNLWQVMQLPKDPVTLANEWALSLARLPYIRYLVDTAVTAGRGDRAYLNTLYLSLVESNQDGIFNGVGSPDIVKLYRAQIRQMILLLEDKQQGWK